jgi:hypothetical protein
VEPEGCSPVAQPGSSRVISVTAAGNSRYQVSIDEGSTRTVHEVTVTPEDLARYAPGETAERLLTASFEFLLEREPKEAILSRFTLPTIERYFPDYPTKVRQLL